MKKYQEKELTSDQERALSLEHSGKRFDGPEQLTYAAINLSADGTITERLEAVSPHFIEDEDL